MANLQLRGRRANARLRSSEAHRHIQGGQRSKISKLDLWANIAQIATAVSLILGIFLASLEIYKTRAELKESAEAAKFAQLPHVLELINQDSQIRGAELEAFSHDWNKEKISQILARYPTVEEAYHSDDLKLVRVIGHHYEVVGALLQLNYVDFDLLYNVVPFPDEFWDATEELRTKARSNWTKDEHGNWKGLPDFWENFGRLQSRYHEQREAARAKQKKK